MYHGRHRATRHAEILRVVHRIRRRWRTRIAVRGLAIVLAATLAGFLLSVYGLELFRFSAPAVVSLRVLLWLATAALVARFLVWPLMRGVSDSVGPTELRSLLCVPLQTPDRFLGILTIGQFQSTRTFEPREISLCRTIANQAAIALENARLVEELRALNRKLETTVRARTARLTRSIRQMGLPWPGRNRAP